jgi:hypothetical protein
MREFIKEVILLCVILFFLIDIRIARGEEYYTDEAIVDSIFIIEGGYKTHYPFGIRSVFCSGYDDCRNVCVNTIKKNRVRYSEYGYRQYNTYLEFLASRYCPLSVDGCENWLSNLKFYLKKEK